MTKPADFDAKAFLKKAPDSPGVYQMYDRENNLLYVGKARHLKKRLASYFNKNQTSAKTVKLVSLIACIELTVAPSEYDALILESNLIKAHKPRYNVLFRDDKSYPYLHLSAGEFPRLDLYRTKHKKLAGQYFGPYPSVLAVRQTLNLIQKVFRLRSCRDSFFRNRQRPCLQYQIKRCTAPCVGYIEKSAYQSNVDLAVKCLTGKSEDVIESLVKQMEQASKDLRYEEAAAFREQITAIRKVQLQQGIEAKKGDADVLAVAKTAAGACVELLSVRDGKVVGNQAYFPTAAQNANEQEMLSAFIAQHYLQDELAARIPAAIITNAELVDRKWLEEALTKMRQAKVKLTHRVRGERANWLALANANASHALMAHLSKKMTLFQQFEALRDQFGLSSLPERIECFDASHTAGEAVVVSCVVFDQQGPQNSLYRRFNIACEKNDDYAALEAALRRRFGKVKTDEGDLPDVLCIDGGKGQLGRACQVLEELQLSGMLVLGIAKGAGRKPGLETLFVANGESAGIHLPADSKALLLLQQVRDEAHRFAISGHRKIREKRRQHSVLEDVEGVGPARRRELLQRFGGLAGLKQADEKALMQVPGISRVLARRIIATLRSQ